VFATEAVLQIETINFMKLPPGLQGLKALQLALHELLGTIGKANYFTTTSFVSITSKTCGTDLLKRLNDTISPRSGDTTNQAKNNKYITHKDGLHIPRRHDLRDLVDHTPSPSDSSDHQGKPRHPGV
jgi:hypothetical protein